MRNQRSRLVVQHVERLSGRILDEHPEVVREYVRERQGIYALYRRTRLYYVGLASDLRGRLKAHLRDRHAGKWDSFSLYLTETGEHLRELEALALRITMPKGNKSKTKFAGSRDLGRYFKSKIKEGQSRELDELFGSSASERKGRRATGQKGRPPTLAAYVSNRIPIRMRYRKRLYKATIRPDGTVRFRGKQFRSPSAAATAVSKRPMNGWSWWRYEVAPGEWVKLMRLRRRKKK